jgi:hypothetical protein
LEALPIGSERIRTRTVRKQPRQERLIKVSHHGTCSQRWRPYARHWWEKHVGKIPEGYNVYHRDGDTLNDDPGNFILCRSDRFRLIFATRPDALRNQQRRRAKGVATANRRRAALRESQLNPSAWYLVLPQSHAIVWQPCRSQRAASRLIVPEQLMNSCIQDRVRITDLNGILYQPGHRTCIVRGSELLAGSGNDGRFEGFIRLVPDVRRAPVKRRSKPAADLAATPSAG